MKPFSWQDADLMSPAELDAYAEQAEVFAATLPEPHQTLFLAALARQVERWCDVWIPR